MSNSLTIHSSKAQLEALANGLPPEGRDNVSAAADWLRTVLAGQLQIPPYPAVALKLQQILKDPDFELSELLAAVQVDPSVSASVLRIANSPFYARAAPCVSLKAAIVRIGVSKVSTIAMMAAMNAGVGTIGPLKRLRRQTMRDAVASAVMSQILAELRGADADVGFTCGLLHDLGTLAAIGTIEKAATAKAPVRVDALPDEAWPLLIDAYHVGIGARIADEWQLPSVVQQAIALHHEEDAGASEAPDIIRIVSASDRIVRLINSRPRVSAPLLSEKAALADENEVFLLEKRIPALPPFLASFNDQAPARPAPASKAGAVAFRPVTETQWTELPEPLVVAADLGGQKKGYRATAMSMFSILLEGIQPLEERSLYEFEVEGAPVLSFWGEIVSCRPSGPGQNRLELRPFCLSAEAWQQWGKLFATVQQAESPPSETA